MFRKKKTTSTDSKHTLNSIRTTTKAHYRDSCLQYEVYCTYKRSSADSDKFLFHFKHMYLYLNGTDTRHQTLVVDRCLTSQE